MFSKYVEHKSLEINSFCRNKYTWLNVFRQIMITRFLIKSYLFYDVFLYCRLYILILLLKYFNIFFRKIFLKMTLLNIDIASFLEKLFLTTNIKHNYYI